MATYIEKRETELTIAFCKHFERRFPKRLYFVMNHQDVRNNGYPDRSVSGYERTTWWEFKHATPDFASPWIQEITCARLAKHSFCRYVIFFEDRYETKTLIVHPDQVRRKFGKLQNVTPEVKFNGFDFDALATYIHTVHCERVELQ